MTPAKNSLTLGFFNATIQPKIGERVYDSARNPKPRKGAKGRQAAAEEANERRPRKSTASAIAIAWPGHTI